MKFARAIISLMKWINRQNSVDLYIYPETTHVFELVKKIRMETEIQMSTGEAVQVFFAAKSANKIQGDFAEVGVFQGGTAKLICEAKGDRPLHLFDTFEGLPSPTEHDDTVFHRGMFAGALEQVKETLADYPNLNFYKGLFPATAKTLEKNKFAFAHLDVDLYESTYACLKFFHPRMTKGGVILVHDYNFSAGVKKAVDIFLHDEPETVLPLAETQCVIIKV